MAAGGGMFALCKWARFLEDGRALDILSGGLSLADSSYKNLLLAQFQSLPCSTPPFTSKPLCIITGATSGLGAATAYALSKEGFYVVLVFSVQVNKDAVSGICFSRSNRYPYARIYEYYKYPGTVKTNIMRDVPSPISLVAFLIMKLLGLLRSPENGVGSILDAALAPPEISGVYFFGGKGRTINSSELSYNARLAQELWTATSDILRSQLALKETFNSSSDFMS